MNVTTAPNHRTILISRLPLRRLYCQTRDFEPYGDTEDLAAYPCYPIAAFPSWPLPLPTGAQRVGAGCDGFYCHNILDPDAHREVTECFDAVLAAQGDCVVPQFVVPHVFLCPCSGVTLGVDVLIIDKVIKRRD